MELLKEYSKILSGIRAHESEIEDAPRLIDNFNKQISKLEKSKEQAKKDFNEKQAAMKEQQLSLKISQKQGELNQKLSSVNANISKYEAKYSEEKQKIMANNYRERLRSRYNLLDTVETTLSNYNPPDKLPAGLTQALEKQLHAENVKYTDNTLKQLCKEVETSFDAFDPELVEVQDSIFDRIISFILLDSLTSAKISNKTKVFIYVLYTALLIAGCIYFPFIIVSLFAVACCVSFSKAAKTNKVLLDCILPYSSLQNGARNLRNQIKTKVNEFRSKDLAVIDQKRSKDLEPYKEEQNKLNSALRTVEFDVRSSFSDEDLQKLASDGLDAQLADIDSKIKDCQQQVTILETSLEDSKSSLKRNLKIRDDLLDRIRKIYLSPEVPGTSYTMVDSFFLGIDEEQGKLIEFKFSGRSTLIVYTGKNSCSNKDLITMMIMQILASMSIASLEIYLTDIETAGMDYSVFFPDTLSSHMHLCTKDQDVSDAIDTIYNVFETRRKTIINECDNFIKYNNAMIQRKSPCAPYIFFFLQDPTPKQMQEQKMQQLLKAGPKAGIIPIVFINNTAITNLAGDSSDSIDSIKGFFDIFQSTDIEACVPVQDNEAAEDRISTLVYDSVRQDLSESPDLVPTIISTISKKGKNRK